MPQDQLVSAGEILVAAGADKPVTAPTFLQRTGLILASSVGALGALVILVLVAGWMHSMPNPPILPANANGDTVKTALENHKALQQIILEPYTTLLDSIVVKILLPIFTSILGYIFGSHASSKET